VSCRPTEPLRFEETIGVLRIHVNGVPSKAILERPAGFVSVPDDQRRRFATLIRDLSMPRWRARRSRVGGTA